LTVDPKVSFFIEKGETTREIGKMQLIVAM